MKLRTGWVSNSSSTAFIITNISNTVKTLVDFVKETPQLIRRFRKQYGCLELSNYTQRQLIGEAENQNIIFQPGESKYCEFGDENGTIIGQVYDYILRDGGESKSFQWEFEESLR